MTKNEGKEYYKKYYQDHSLERKKAQRIWYKTLNGRTIHLLKGARNRAKYKKLEFNLTKGFIKEKLLKDVCEYSGIKLNFKASKNPRTPSLDRRNNKLGYTKRNTFLVAWGINSAKEAWNKKEWQDLKKIIKLCKY